jgi:hypothetical protein
MTEATSTTRETTNEPIVVPDHLGRHGMVQVQNDPFNGGIWLEVVGADESALLEPVVTEAGQTRAMLSLRPDAAREIARRLTAAADYWS